MKTLQYFKVRNLDKYQTFNKHRGGPSWVKIYSTILEDIDVNSLKLADRFLFIALIILGSRLKNRLPLDLDWLRFCLHTKEPISLTTLFERGFLQKCGGRPSKYPEREEKSRESRYRVERADARATSIPQDFLLTDERRRKLEAIGVASSDVPRLFAQFRAHHEARGSIMKNWDAALRTWAFRHCDFHHQRKGA